MEKNDASSETLIDGQTWSGLPLIVILLSANNLAALELAIWQFLLSLLSSSSLEESESWLPLLLLLCSFALRRPTFDDLSSLCFVAWTKNEKEKKKKEKLHSELVVAKV